MLIKRILAPALASRWQFDHALADITGAGATFRAPSPTQSGLSRCVQVWVKNTGTGLDHQSIGLAAASAQITTGTVDFGAPSCCR